MLKRNFALYAITFLNLVCGGLASAQTVDTKLPPPHYFRGTWAGNHVYVVSAHPSPLTHGDYIASNIPIPDCRDAAKDDHDAVQFISSKIMDAVLKAGLKAAGIPTELATFAGPLTDVLSVQFTKGVKQDGGSVKEFLGNYRSVKSGSRLYRRDACRTTRLQGSRLQVADTKRSAVAESRRQG